MSRVPKFEDTFPPADVILASAAAPASTIVLPAGTRGLLVGTAGTLNCRLEGSTADRTGVPIQAGWNPGLFTTILAGGTAANIWAVI